MCMHVTYVVILKKIIIIKNSFSSKLKQVISSQLLRL